MNHLEQGLNRLEQLLNWETDLAKGISNAENILRGQQASPKEILAVAMSLKNERSFGYARRLLSRARQDSAIEGDPQLAMKLRQEHALCTYKDPDLPTDLKFERAVEILAQGEDLNTTKNQETLGIGGAIYKNKWEALGQRADLERALAYYIRGYAEGIAGDFGYTAINAAFILDVIADQEIAVARNAYAASDTPASRRSEARRIREEIAAQLPPLAEIPKNAFLKKKWWFYVSVAEALFGLKRYSEASPWLQSARALPDVPEWELESTARQLASLTRLVDPVGRDLSPEPRRVLEEFLGTASGVTAAYIGKVGLALSGGAFRAALFHIGVLARLAELDVLRQVEVLSCVSGGSIVGAYYYLELRQLLQTKTENEIRRQDYIDIIQRIQREFLAGIQRNIRTRVLANPWTNIRMLLFPHASRTQRVGELYEKHLFSRVSDGDGGAPRWISGLTIQPKDDPRFSPKSNNWRRRNEGADPHPECYNVEYGAQLAVHGHVDGRATRQHRQRVRGQIPAPPHVL